MRRRKEEGGRAAKGERKGREVHLLYLAEQNATVSAEKTRKQDGPTSSCPMAEDATYRRHFTFCRSGFLWERVR